MKRLSDMGRTAFFYLFLANLHLGWNLTFCRTKICTLAGRAVPSFGRDLRFTEPYLL